MPASEEFYRDQKKLHVWFLWTSLAMFGATIWMLAVDHNLSWKKVQLDFLNVKREKLQDDFVAETHRIDETKLDDLKSKLKTSQEKLAGQRKELQAIEAEKEKLKPKLESKTRFLAFKRADEAAYASQFDLDREAAQDSKDGGNAKRSKKFAKATEADLKQLKKLHDEIVAASAEVDKISEEMKTIDGKITAMNADVEAVEKDLRDLNKAADALDRAIKSTDYGAAQTIRALPIIDGFASPLRVKQTFHEDLQLDYNFKKVTRFDRCMTCHLAIDQKGFSPDKAKQPYCSHPHQELYVDSASPHPVEKFGCTVCHQGQGTATAFDWASHTPNDSKQRKTWTHDQNWFFNEFHEQPMLPKRFIESSCLKCHHDPFQIPQATKLNQGYQVVRNNGCYGCHEINGFKDDGTSIGPNLRISAKTDSPEVKARSLRKVGPNLARVSEKLTEDFVAKWIRNPQAFRPTSKMPQFYHQMDLKDGFYGEGPDGEFEVGAPDGADKKYAHAHKLADLANIEIDAMTTYLLEKSKEHVAADKLTVPEVAGKGDAAKGKTLFMTKGCVACHNHKDHINVNPKIFGPNLSEVAAKFVTDGQKKWLRAWIKNPTFYNPESYMPNLYLADGEVADLAAYLLSVPAKWDKEVTVPSVEQIVKTDAQGLTHDPLRDLLIGIEIKNQKSRDEAAATVDKLSPKEKLVSLGQKTIGRLGCYACHNIPGFDDAKPIGVALADWGRKDIHKLTFENVHELVNKELESLTPAEKAEHFYTKNDYYTWAIEEHQREGFLMQKLREPRGYDYKKIKRWEDRTRMPKFNLTDAERESVQVFVLGLVGEEVNRKYVYNPPNPKKAEYEGRSLLDLYNCTSCHVIKPGEYKFNPSEKAGGDILGLAKKELDADYTDPFFTHHNAWAPPELVKQWLAQAEAKHDAVKAKTFQAAKVPPIGKEQLTLRGLTEGVESEDGAEDPADLKTFIRLWYATQYQGQAVPAGIKIAVPKSQWNPANMIAQQGGEFALALVDYLMMHPTEPGKQPNAFDASERDKSWAKAPPPLIREGEKVQTPWLYGFLREPYPIRKTAVLRMPKFNFRNNDVTVLANYFAAADKQPFPYIETPEREDSYLAKMDSAHRDYLDSGFKLVTNKELCVKCHEIGGIKAVGKPEELGPSLVRAQERLRPDWMLRWITNPKRFVPYTGMPVNFPKDKSQYQDAFKAANLDQIRAARDLLLNYAKVVDAIMMKNQPTAAAPATAAPAAGKGVSQ